VANSNVHFLVGAGVSVGVYLGFCRLTNKQPTILGALATGVTGGVVALLPDFLEPAIHPNHRAFFHSVATLGLSAYLGLCQVDDPQLSQDDKFVALLGSLAYISHLLLDGFTPKSLPVI
jgi:inner membrane protein